MKKLALGVATALATLAVAPGVLAATETFGSAKDITADDSYIGESEPTVNIVGNDTASVIATYGNLELKYVDDSGDEENRGQDAAWIGLQITAPSSVTSANMEKVTLAIDGKPVSGFNFGDSKDGGDTGAYLINVYAPITTEILTQEASAGHNLFDLRSWTFDWDGEGGMTPQTFTVQIDTTKVTLNTLQEENAFTPAIAEQLIKDYNEKQEAANQPEVTPEEENANPNTADPVALYATVAVVALVGLGATAVIASKARR